MLASRRKDADLLHSALRIGLELAQQQIGSDEQHIVSAGASYGSLIVIDKGVNEGDRVIVGNLQKIAAGGPVRPEPPKDGAT